MRSFFAQGRHAGSGKPAPLAFRVCNRLEDSINEYLFATKCLVNFSDFANGNRKLPIRRIWRWISWHEAASGAWGGPSGGAFSWSADGDALGSQRIPGALQRLIAQLESYQVAA